MDNFPVIALEGISYSGKTTMLNLCKKNGLSALKELSEISTFPKIPQDSDKIRIVDEWFYNQHVSRIKEIVSASNTNSVILDRYFLSDLAYVYARFHTYKVGDLDFYKSLLINGVAVGKIIIPWFVYISIDIELYISRKLKDEKKRIYERGLNQMIRCPYDFNQKIFFENQISFYQSFFKRNFDKVLIVDGNLDPDFLCAHVLNWINQLPNALPSQTINL